MNMCDIRRARDQLSQFLNGVKLIVQSEAEILKKQLEPIKDDTEHEVKLVSGLIRMNISALLRANISDKGSLMFVQRKAVIDRLTKVLAAFNAKKHTEESIEEEVSTALHELMTTFEVFGPSWTSIRNLIIEEASKKVEDIKDFIHLDDEKEKTYEDEEEETEEHKPDGFIRFEVDNVSNLDEDGQFSPEVEVKGVPWRANVLKRGSIGAMLHCMENQSPLWRICAQYTMSILNSDRKHHAIREGRSSFNCNGTASGGCILKWSDLIDEKKGYIKDDKITVEIRFWISNMTGIRTNPIVDFSKNLWIHNMTLIIDGKKVYVGKQILAIYSPFFNSMFYGNFAEKNKNEIELKDIDRKEFIELLHIIYPSNKKITDENADILLKLADRFHIKKVIDQVEKFLIDSSKFDDTAKLLLADQYRLAKLQEHCLSEGKTSEEVVDSQYAIDFSDPNEPRNDVTLVVGGVKFYASKQFLTILSPRFSNALCGRTFLDVDKDMSSDEFLEMLRVIYPSYRKVTDGNVNFLLKLADRFDIKLLFDLAEDHLISSSTQSNASKLLLSDKYELIKLQDHIFRSVKTCKEVKRISKTPEYRSLSYASKTALLEKMLPLV